ncbi:MAG: hypothetical protein ACK47B_25255 [Armatimonadota bacterium]
MREERTDPWAGERISRSEVQRRYNNLIQYQLRPMMAQRNMSDDARINVLKRIVRECSRFKYDSGAVAGGGSREEVVDLLTPWLKPEHPSGEELKDWVKRTIRAFGASIESND